MPAKQSAINEAKSGDLAKITKEDAAEMQGWQSLIDNTKKDPPADPPNKRVVLDDEPPMYELISDSKQGRDQTDFACGFDSGQKLLFCDVTKQKLYGLEEAYKQALASKNGIVLLRENSDDLLSSDRDDRQISYIPSGDVAIMVSNTSNGADQFTVNYECDLNKNILITTSDGVEYCMPFEVVMMNKPGTKSAILSEEELIIAGLKDAPPAKTYTPPAPRKTPPRENPVVRDKLENDGFEDAERVSSDDPRLMGPGGKQIWDPSEGSAGSTHGGTKTSKSPGSSSKTVSKGDPVASLGAGAKTGITSTYSGGSSSSSSGTKTATKKTGVSRTESDALSSMSFKPFTFTLGGF